MISVEAINIAPVKSLGLVHLDRVQVSPVGIIEDRRFHLTDGRGGLLTQRQAGKLVQVKAAYQDEPEWLTLRFPNLDSLEGSLELGEAVVTTMWGRDVPGRLVLGDWSAALTDYCQHPVQLVRSDHPGQCYDEYPVSLLSQASVELLGELLGEVLGKMSGSVADFDSRRFRPTFLLTGCQPHEEDTWIGHVIRIGDDLAIRVVARDPRCTITTHNPDTGETDIDTLRLILSYRPSPVAPYFGVYGLVERPGAVSVGDEVVAPSLVP